MEWQDFKNNPPEYTKLYPNGNKETDNILVCDNKGNITVAYFFEYLKGDSKYLEIPFVNGYEYEFDISIQDILYWIPLPEKPAGL